jgi:hypothetical protein
MHLFYTINQSNSVAAVEVKSGPLWYEDKGNEW